MKKISDGKVDAIDFPYLLKQYESLHLRELYENPANVALPGETAAVRTCDTNLLNAVNESVIIPPPPYIPHI